MTEHMRGGGASVAREEEDGRAEEARRVEDGMVFVREKLESCAYNWGAWRWLGVWRSGHWGFRRRCQVAADPLHTRAHPTRRGAQGWVT